MAYVFAHCLTDEKLSLREFKHLAQGITDKAWDWDSLSGLYTSISSFLLYYAGENTMEGKCHVRVQGEYKKNILIYY